jgi:ABC-type transport system involved in multi-copper enzyme maturation permease subunit
MAWVIWRQHRIALGAVAAALSGLAIYVWIVGLQLHHAHTAATTCNPNSPACADLITHFNFMNHALQGGYALQLVPPLIGAFVGAPLLARELEAGTFRFAWTQGLERWRWTLAKLAALGLVVTVAAGALSVLFSWYYQPYLAASNQALELSGLSPFGGGVFDLRGVSLAAWTLTAFAIGALAGVLIRRVVPAIVATLAAYSGLALIAANLLRQHYLTPLLSSNVNLPGSSWIIRQYWTQGGTFAFTSSRAAPQSLVHACSGAPPGPLGKPPVQAFAQCAAQHGYTRLTSYQPASRFWPFQWIEGGWLLVLSALLIAVTVWLVHRRAA